MNGTHVVNDNQESFTKVQGVPQHGFGTNLKSCTLIVSTENSFFHFYTDKMLGKNACWILKYTKYVFKNGLNPFMDTLYIKRERDREKNRVGAAVLTHFNISQWGL